MSSYAERPRVAQVAQAATSLTSNEVSRAGYDGLRTVGFDRRDLCQQHLARRRRPLSGPRAFGVSEDWVSIHGVYYGRQNWQEPLTEH